MKKRKKGEVAITPNFLLFLKQNLDHGDLKKIAEKAKMHYSNVSVCLSPYRSKALIEAAIEVASEGDKMIREKLEAEVLPLSI